MGSSLFEREDVVELLGARPGLLRAPSEHADAWFASLPTGVPLFLHALGLATLEGFWLELAALDAAFGSSSAIISIQSRMTEGRSDPRRSERREIERVAQLPLIPPIRVDVRQWENLRASQDRSLTEAERALAVGALDAFALAEPAAFARLNAAAASHDHAVGGLVARATWNEDALVFAAAARTLWERTFGNPAPLPKLPAHVAVFALSFVFEPLSTGAILGAAGLLATPQDADFRAEPTRTALRHEVDRSLRFWRERAKAAGTDPTRFAAEFLQLLGNLVRAEADAAEALPERAQALRRARVQPGGFACGEESAE